MEQRILNDQSVIPDEKLVFSIIGDKSVLWKKIMDYLYDNNQDISEMWRFYTDGNSWLFRTLKKKKTIFWLMILKDTFRVSFYLADKAEKLIEESDLPEQIKDDFRSAKRSKFGRSLSVVITSPKDADNVIMLTDIKLKVR